MDDIFTYKKLNLKSATAQSLLLSENFEAVKYQAYELIDSQDWDGILNYATVLEDKLKEISIKQDSPETNNYLILRFWVLRLWLVTFRNLSSLEKADLLKNHCMEMLYFDLDLKGALFKFIDLFDYDKIILTETKAFITALSSSTEIWGSETAKFQQKNFKPTVGNWLAEYQKVLNSAKKKEEAGVFQIVKFMDSNEYAKLLTEDEKTVLKDLLDVYNWLLNPIIYSDDNKSTQTSSYINSEKLELPQELREQKVPPSIPAPKNAPTMKPMEDVVSKPTTGSMNFGGGSKQFNIQDLLRKKEEEFEAGLRAGEGKSFIPNQPQKSSGSLGASNLPKKEEIDQKLDQLKKKTGV